MRFLARSAVAVVAAVVAASASGCSRSDEVEPAPVTTSIPTAAADGAELLCGMDRADLEGATGFATGRTEGELAVVDGVGAGVCSVWAENESLITGSLANVRMYAASSPDGLLERSRLLGQDDLPAPDLTYQTVDGGIWGDVEATPGQMTLGAVSVVFVGETVIEVLLASADVGRDPAADQLALTQQVAATYAVVGAADAS